MTDKPDIHYNERYHAYYVRLADRTLGPYATYEDAEKAWRAAIRPMNPDNRSH